MNKFVKEITFDKIEYEFLRSLNGLLGLTDREMELLSIFLSLSMDNARNKTQTSIDSSSIRKSIMAETGITKDNLSRYMKSLRKKGLLIYNPNSKITSINKALMPIVIGGKTVQITLILKVNETN